MKANLIKLILLISPVFLLFGFGHQQKQEKVNDFYSVEKVEIPASVFPEIGGMSFMPNGDLAVCFHRGEVMIYNPKNKTWKMFADGLQDPLGLLAVNNNELLVMQRGEMTRLVDKDKNGVAEDYETVTDAWGLSGNYCEFGYGPVKDKQGNMYISLNTASNGDGIWNETRGEVSKYGRLGRMYSAVPYRGWVMELTKEGKLIPFASGFRSPNGIGLDKDDQLWVTDNQGDWLGSSKLYNVKKGGFYGHAPSLVWTKGWNPAVNPLEIPVPKLDSMRTKESVFFPHGDISHSPTQPVIIPQGFGPFGGQMVVGEMDYPKLMRVMLEKVKGAYQGAVCNFIDSAGLTRGNERLSFTSDGKTLFLGKTAYTWVGAQGMQKVDFKGGTPMDVLKMNVVKDGFKLTFTRPLAPGKGVNPEDYIFTRYYYEYHQAYGSNKFDVQPVKVTSVKISDDRKEATLQLEKMMPGYIYYLQVGNKPVSETGAQIMNKKIWYTLNNTL